MHGNTKVPQTIAELKTRCHILESGCWEFRKPDGSAYNTPPQVGSYRQGKSATKLRPMTMMAWAYQLAGGTLGSNQVTRHRDHCTFKYCCNPDHLYAGSWPGKTIGQPDSPEVRQKKSLGMRRYLEARRSAGK